MEPFGGVPMENNNYAPSVVVNKSGNGLMKAYSISGPFGHSVSPYGLKRLCGTTNQDVIKSLDKAFYCCFLNLWGRPRKWDACWRLSWSQLWWMLSKGSHGNQVVTLLLMW